MNKIDWQEMAIDSLSWITAPATLIVWGHITFPLWSPLPPALIILIALGLLVAIVHVLEKVLPEDSPPWIWIVRGLQMGIGLIVGLVGVLPE